MKLLRLQQSKVLRSESITTFLALERFGSRVRPLVGLRVVTDLGGQHRYSVVHVGLKRDLLLVPRASGLPIRMGDKFLRATLRVDDLGRGTLGSSW